MVGTDCIVVANPFLFHGVRYTKYVRYRNEGGGGGGGRVRQRVADFGCHWKGLEIYLGTYAKFVGSRMRLLVFEICKGDHMKCV